MGTIREYYEDAIHNAKNDIDSKDDAYLLSVEAKELVQYYVDRFQLTLIERDYNRKPHVEKDKAVPRRAEFDPSIIIGRKIHLKIFYPIVPKRHNKEVIQRRASMVRVSGNILDFNNVSLIVTVFLSEKNVNQDTKITRAIEDLEEVIGWKNANVQEGNKKLETELSKYILQIQNQLSADNELIEEIIEKVPIKLQRRTTSIPMIDLTIREEIKPVYPTSEKIEDLSIEVDKVEAVIKLLKNAGYSFKTTPQVFSTKFKEGELRDILLSQLNAVFEGAATGETFVKKGKADIHLSIKKGSILSAECKFWDGEKLYLSMMEQLFGYLTWRQNYGILITFSRRKNFTSVIETAKATAQASPTTLNNSLEIRDKSHFVTTNRLPEDTKKLVTLHHLLFNLFFEQ